LLLIMLLHVGTASAQACPAGEGHFVKPTDGDISRGFGMTLNPLTGNSVLHTGIDIDARIGQPVRSAEAGTVVSVKITGALGKVVRVKHGGGFESEYAHLSRIEVAKGDCLNIGGRLGAVGNTGVSGHPHLHFEIIENGQAIDPLRLFRANQR
jgi:murein DD-endopeptidase MepM/ murein hydrolase activator NlpD